MVNVERPQKAPEINASIAFQIQEILTVTNIISKSFKTHIIEIPTTEFLFSTQEQSIQLLCFTTIVSKQRIFYDGSFFWAAIPAICFNPALGFAVAVVGRGASVGRSSPPLLTKRQILKPGFTLLSGLQIGGYITIIFKKPNLDKPKFYRLGSI